MSFCFNDHYHQPCAYDIGQIIYAHCFSLKEYPVKGKDIFEIISVMTFLKGVTMKNKSEGHWSHDHVELEIQIIVFYFLAVNVRGHLQ